MNAARIEGLKMMGVGALLVLLGVGVLGPERPAGAVVNVTPGPGAHAYTDTAQSDAESEGEGDSVYTVTASDGTTTENHIRPDDTVWGIVTTPDGKSFTFGTDEKGK